MYIQITGGIRVSNTNNEKNSQSLAGRTYDPKDYESNSELASGLATTHEQVSDTLTEGTIEAKIDNVNGKNIDILREGYKK